MSFDSYGMYWAEFIRRLRSQHNEMLTGLYVVQAHDTHGLHYHFITQTRISIHLMRRVIKRTGIGRINVKKCNRGAGYYLERYLEKGDRLAMGVKRWGSIGGFNAVKQNDIVIESTLTRNLATLTGGKQIRYTEYQYLAGVTKTWGGCQGWPAHVWRRVNSYVNLTAVYQKVQSLDRANHEARKARRHKSEPIEIGADGWPI